MATRGALNLFRSPWDPELIAQCWLGVCRFDDFQERLGISRQVLAQRLKDLVAERILVREQYQSRPNRYEYRLTEKGRDLLPVFVAMMEWSERWRPDHPAEKWRAVYARFQEEQPQPGKPAGWQGAPLTRREREVAQLVALGMTNKEIACRLVVAPRTAATHVDRILGKFGFNSRSQIVAMFAQQTAASSARTSASP